MLMVSYCDQSMSVVRRALCVIGRQQFVVSPAKQKRDICIAFPASSLSSSSSAA